MTNMTCIDCGASVSDKYMEDYYNYHEDDEDIVCNECHLKLFGEYLGIPR